MPPKNATQYELWADLARQNAHLRRNNWLHWCVHLVLVAALALGSLKPLPIVRVDRVGRAELLAGAAGPSAPAPEEAEHVARLMSTYLLEVTSGSVARDLGKALVLMTSQFARAYNARLREDQNLPLMEKGNIRTVLEFDDKGTQVRAEKAADGGVTRYFVTLRARLSVFRADVLTAPLLARDALVRVTLLVVPRTPRTLNGLLVDFFEKELLEPQAATPTLSTTPLPVAAQAAPAATAVRP